MKVHHRLLMTELNDAQIQLSEVVSNVIYTEISDTTDLPSTSREAMTRHESVLRKASERGAPTLSRYFGAPIFIVYRQLATQRKFLHLLQNISKAATRAGRRDCESAFRLFRIMKQLLLLGRERFPTEIGK